ARGAPEAHGAAGLIPAALDDEAHRRRLASGRGNLLPHVPVRTHDDAERPAADLFPGEPARIETCLRYVEPLVANVGNAFRPGRSAAACEQCDERDQECRSHGSMT